jgi:outer membrane receptor for ferric coprogen and ferric-rhodotorulic acid
MITRKRVYWGYLKGNANAEDNQLGNPSSPPRTILELVDEFGSFELYLRALRVAGGEQLQIKDVSKRFARLGHTSTTIVFLYAVGEDTPKALAAWKASHGGRLP